MYRVDKTEKLEKILSETKTVYLEGAAACGKSTAVEMLLKKHPEVTVDVIDLSDLEELFDIKDRFSALKMQMTVDAKTERWTNCLVFENIPDTLSEETANLIVSFVRKMPSSWRGIFVSREQPAPAFLELLWKEQMEILTQKDLSFTVRDLQKYVANKKCPISAKQLYHATGGWAGCVALMVKLSKNSCQETGIYYLKTTAEELREKYEIDTYIQKEIIGQLSQAEQKLTLEAMYLPWVSEDMCREVLGIENPKELLISLERKGIFISNPLTGRWQVALMFNVVHQVQYPWKCRNYSKTGDAYAFFHTAGKWYEKKGALREALWFVKNYGSKEDYKQMLLDHYQEIPYVGMAYEEVLTMESDRPELYYLRGMCYLRMGQPLKMTQEENRLKKEQPEMYLNLLYANPNIELDAWLKELIEQVREKKKAGKKEPFKLYHMLGYSYTYLCGVRDLTGLFACKKSEENKKAALWKEAFGELEWVCYIMAKIDYYLETDRERSLSKEELQIVASYTKDAVIDQISIMNWRPAFAALNLLYRMENLHTQEEKEIYTKRLKRALLLVGDMLCSHNTEAIVAVNSPKIGEPEYLSHWILSMEGKEDNQLTITEMKCLIKGYISQQQIRLAEPLIQKTLVYLTKYQANYFYTEILFQRAMANWANKLTGQAIKDMVECFMISSNNRYVKLYTSYGAYGLSVLKDYIEWMKNNTSEERSAKKKYNYRNVLRMPMEEYLEILLRKAKKALLKAKTSEKIDETVCLTMMETIILQAISKGMSNADICEWQNLKISTVKTHIYSLFKKLGVRSRVQATIRAKELGILK